MACVDGKFASKESAQKNKNRKLDVAIERETFSKGQVRR
jgi:hypothetical protein